MFSAEVLDWTVNHGGRLIDLWSLAGVPFFNPDPTIYNADLSDCANYVSGLKSAQRRGTLSVVREILKERGVKV